MLGEVVSRTSLITYPLIGLLLFVGIFISTFVWAWSPGRKKHFERMANLANVVEEGAGEK